MAAHTPLQGDRAAWCRERLEFFSAVINNLDRERLKAELENCETEEDAEGLMHSLLWLQDNMHTHFQGGATAIDPPEPHEPPEREFEHDIAEEHQPLYVAVEDQPAQQPLMLDPWTLNIPMDAGEPHAILQDVVYLGNHEQQQRREEEEEQQEEHEHVDFEDYEAPPQAMCEPEVLDVARPESHIHQPLEMEEEEEEEEEQQHQEYQQEQQLQQEQQQNDQDLLLQHAPLRRTDCPQPGPVSDLVFADALDFPHPAHMHDFPAGRPADDASDAEDPEWVEVESRENTPVTARSDVDTDADTEPMEPISDPYFDVDEPSTEDFVDVEDVPLEEMVVMPSSQAEANIQPAADDLEVEGTTGGLENDPLADEELAKELSDAINEEERRRLESDEQMARALAEQMEMEERQREEEEKRREEEDEELARRLAEEIQNEEVEQLEQRRQRLEENMVPSDSEREEGPDGDEELAQQAHDEELARQMEAEVLEEMREEEDEKAGRVAALINMFPDADPTYLTER
ncbi:hypothetical protein E2C01_067131 [Portunus trituberculatus]|uniref:Uncharacterized protein n=2 Tax=Portunus trituberculatus TaxID=210409 RepID=A0A5B7HU77_PORTR|nr:hypothetical protein [Portunus trituberculatus]